MEEKGMITYLAQVVKKIQKEKVSGERWMGM